MKKNYKIIIGVVLVIIISILIFLAISNSKGKEKVYAVTEDSLKFEKDHEEINAVISESSGKEYLTVNLASNSPVKYSSYEEIFKILENGSGVIYFGFPECPWCRNLVAPLTSSAMEHGVKNIYYLNNKEDRNILSLNKKGKIVTEKKGSAEYIKLVQILEEYLPEYKGLKDKKIKRLYFPSVLFVKDGVVTGLVQSLESYSARAGGNAYMPMNQEEILELKNIFKDNYKKIES